MSSSYWGLYCPQHGVWLQSPSGKLIHYPAQEIAQAQLDMEKRMSQFSIHKYEATEFGNEHFTPKSTLKAVTELCPLLP